MRTRLDVAIAAIAVLAATQHHVFTDAQALACGLDDDALAVRSGPGGPFRRVPPRTYELVGSPDDPLRPAMAALLSVGPGAAASHQTAGRVVDLDGVPLHGAVHLSGPGAAHRVDPSLVVHGRAVPEDLVVVTDGIRHTTPLRTIRDLAAVLNDDDLECAVESAVRLGVPLDDVEALLDDRFWGARRLARVLAVRPHGAPPTGSELETRYLQLLRRFGIETPVRQFALEGAFGVDAQLDVSWPHRRVSSSSTVDASTTARRRCSTTGTARTRSSSRSAGSRCASRGTT